MTAELPAERYQRQARTALDALKTLERYDTEKALLVSMARCLELMEQLKSAKRSSSGRRGIKLPDGTTINAFHDAGGHLVITKVARDGHTHQLLRYG